MANSMSNQSEVILTELEYHRLQRLIVEIKERMEEIEAIITIDEGEEGLPRKYLLLKRINEEGGVVTKQKFNELSEEVGYVDVRGSQGLFAWGGKYVTLISGDRVAITKEGTRVLRKVGLIP